MSQSELGKKLGEGDFYRESLTYQQIQNYENGLNKISGGTLYKLSQIFKIEVNDFFNGFKNSDEAQPEYVIMQKLRSISDQSEKDNLRDKMLLLISEAQKKTY
jgi:transcriptional regulator with XRE-family HTH domain